MGILDKIAGKRSSADIERDRLAVIAQADQLSVRVADAKRSLNADALEADVTTLSRAQSELAALKLKRQALSAKAEALAVERDTAAAREAEGAKAEQDKAKRLQHADAIKRMPAAIAKVRTAHAALNSALRELDEVDPYAGAMANIHSRPAMSLPEGFASYAATWDEIAPEAIRVRSAIMDGQHLSYSVRDDDCGRNVAASKVWGYV